MTSTSSLRDRRLANRQIELKQQFVVFWMRQAWFAIPIASMHRAIPIETDIPIITQAGIEVPIIDLGEIIFSEQQPILSNTLESRLEVASLQFASLQFGNAEVSAQKSLILVKALIQTKSIVGILIDSQPVLQRILDSEFIPIPDNYRTDFDSQLLKSMIPSSSQNATQDTSRPEIFLLNPDLIPNPKI